jgi:hypothetical protein
MVNPAGIVMVSFCPVCGRDDRYKPFTGKSHFSRCEKCKGELVKLVYVLSEQ